MYTIGPAPSIWPVVTGNPITKTLKNIFDDYITRIDKTIQDAINSGNYAAIGLLSLAGDQLEKLIDHSANAYKDSLDYTLDTVSAEIHNFLIELETMIKDFESMVEANIQDTATLAQQIVNTLPLANLQPQLTSTKPRCFVVTNINGNSTVSFHGNFFWAGHYEEGLFQDDDYTPQLTFGDRKCVLLHKENDDLEFEFPNAVFGNLPSKKYSKATGILSVFWKEQGWILNTRRENRYHITLLALPIIAGTVIATFKSQTTEVIRIEKHFSETVAGAGTLRTFTYKPDAGFLFDLGSIKVAKYPDCYPVTSNFHPDALTYTVHLNTNSRYARFGFGIQVSQLRNNVALQPDVTQSMELRWNESTTLNPNQQTGSRCDLSLSQFTFVDCRNKTSIFLSPYHNQGILKVQKTANGILKLTAEIPKDLNSFMNGN